jgi:hypothetical protein
MNTKKIFAMCIAVFIVAFVILFGTFLSNFSEKLGYSFVIIFLLILSWFITED